MTQQNKPLLDPRLNEHLADQEFGVLSIWCQVVECSIDLDQWLGGGRSEAKLAVVTIQDGRSQRKGVLKYCPFRGKPSASIFSGFIRAERSGPRGFAKKHLVGIDPAGMAPVINGNEGLFILMQWRAGGRMHYDTMATLLEREALGAACETIVTSLLEKWNSGPSRNRQSYNSLTAKSFLQEIVGRRCEPGGPIHAAVQRLRQSGLTPPVADSRPGLTGLIVDSTSGAWLDDVSVVGLRGNAHGDLHPDNILLPQPPGTELSAAQFQQYILIDLSTFSEDRLLAADPAHLLLSIVARRLSDPLSERSRARLSQFLLDPEHQGAGGIPTELVSAARGIQKAGAAFAESRNLYDDWRKERLLAMIGCALLFVGRDLPDDGRRWFLQFAMTVADAFGDMVRRRDGRAANGDSRAAITQAGTSGWPAPATQSPAEASPPPATDAPGQGASGIAASQQGSGSPGELAPLPDDAATIPVRDETDLPQSADHPASPTPSAVKNSLAIFIELSDELAAKISELRAGLSPDEAFTATTSARDKAEELKAVMAKVCKWYYESQTRPTAVDITAIEIAQVRLREVIRQLTVVCEQGIHSNSLDDLAAAVERLQQFIRKISPRPDGPPGS
jgi:hypothetical protein